MNECWLEQQELMVHLGTRQACDMLDIWALRDLLTEVDGGFVMSLIPIRYRDNILILHCLPLDNA